MSASLHSPLNKFIGTQRAQTAHPSRVPAFGPRDDPWIALTGKNPEANKIPDARKKQLLGLLDKERNKEKRERVAHVLSQKFIAKFGAKHTNIIVFFVEELLSSKDNVRNDDIVILEKEIRNAMRAKDEELSRAQALRKTVTVQAEAQAPLTSQSMPTLERPPSGKEWVIIQALQAVQDEEETKRKREKAQRDKLKFRAALEEQMDYSKKAASSNDDDARYYNHVQKDLVAFQEENHRKAEAQKKKYADELRFRREQIQDQQRRSLEEKEALLLMEERNARLIQETIEREQQAQQAARQRENERKQVIERENEQNKRAREEEKRREAEEDQRLMREYAMKLDREAREREEAFSKRMKEMEKYGAKFETEGAGKAQREEQLRFEQMLLKEQARKEAEDQARERAKQEERQRKMQAATKENQRQISVKSQQKVIEKASDGQLKLRFQQETEEFVRQQEEQKRKLREAQERYRHQLEAQAEEAHKADTNMQGITAQERLLNMGTLRAMESDPVLMSKVLHRVRLSKSRGAMK